MKDWFVEASHNRDTVKITVKNAKHLIYRGFKLTKIGDSYSIVDVRTNDFYSEVKEDDLRVFEDRGFIAGADYLVYNRDCERVKAYTKRVSRLLQLKESYQQKRLQNKPFFDKRIKNCITNWEIFSELLAFYSARKVQLNRKYNFEN